jgi:hypothetical protein
VLAAPTAPAAIAIPPNSHLVLVFIRCPAGR